MRKAQEADKLMLRLPDGLRKAIKLAAIENERTMNAEVVYHLKRAYAETEKAGASA